jgi:hypothetical protein
LSIKLIDLRIDLFDGLAKMLGHADQVASVEQLVEYLFEGGVVGEWPECLLLVAEDYLLEDVGTHLHQFGDLLVHLGALVVYRLLVALAVDHLQLLLQGLELKGFAAALEQAKFADFAGLDFEAIGHPEAEFDLAHDISLPSDRGVQKEVLATVSVGGHLPADHEPESLDDGRLAGPILAPDEGQRVQEADPLHVLVGVGTQPRYTQIYNRTHSFISFGRPISHHSSAL